MSVRLAMQKTHTLAGKSYQENQNITADTEITADRVVAAAKTGTLTTRTSATVGTLTMSASHGITTGSIIDMYWTGGYRRGVTVGTVSGNSVPFSGGSGDNLPTGTFPSPGVSITAMNPVVFPFNVIGDNMQGLLMYSQGVGVIAILDGSNVKLYAKQFPLGPQVHEWITGSGVTNPLAGVTAAKVRFSHAETVTKNMTCGAAVN